MSVSKEKQERIETGPMQVALLNEIAERLLALEKFAREENPTGIVEPIEDITITERLRSIRPLKGKWFSISLINDGPNDVYAIVNSPKSSETPHRVAVNETYNINMYHELISDVLLSCLHGLTSHVRLVGTR